MTGSSSSRVCAVDASMGPSSEQHGLLRQKARWVSDRLRYGRFTRDVGVAFGASSVALLLRAAQVAVLARWLGPEGKGLVELAVLLPVAMALLFNGGISVGNTYFAGSGRYGVQRLARHSVSFTLVTTAVSGAVVAVAALTGWFDRLLPGVPGGLIALGLLELPFFVLLTNFNGLLQGMHRISLVSGLRLGRAAALFLLTAVFVGIAPWEEYGGVAASAAASGVVLVAALVALRRAGASFSPAWEGRAVRDSVSYGMRAQVGNVLQFFNYRLDLFLVNHFLGIASVGLYSLAVNFAELVWYFPNAVGFVIFPRAAAVESKEMDEFTPRVLRWTVVLTLVAGGLLALVARPVIDVFFPRFADSYDAMLILLPGVVLIGGAKVLTNEMAGRGYAHYNSINAAVAVVLTVILDLVLIPRHGITGAAVASTLSYAVTFLVALWMFRTVRSTPRSAP